jgi:hypothetical protein
MNLFDASKRDETCVDTIMQCMRKKITEGQSYLRNFVFIVRFLTSPPKSIPSLSLHIDICFTYHGCLPFFDTLNSVLFCVILLFSSTLLNVGNHKQDSNRII